MANNTLTQKGSAKSNYGKIGWSLIITSGIGFMLTGAFWTALAPNILVPYIAQQVGAESTATVLYANSLVTVLTIAVSFLMGTLHQKFGNRKLQLLEYLLSAVGLILVGHVTSIVLYVIVWTITFSMAYCVSNVVIPSVFNNYMPTKKGSALGWATGFSTVGGSFLLMLLNALVGRGAVALAGLVFGIITAVIGIIYFFLWPEDPRERGYTPDNGDISPEELEAFENAKKNRSSNWTTKEILSNKNFWIISICYGLFFLCQTTLSQQMVPWLVQNGIPQTAAAMLMAGIGMTGIISSVISGYVDQKWGTKLAAALMAVFYFLSACSAGWLPFTSVSMVLYIAFYVCVIGALSNIPASHAISLYGPDFPKAWKMSIVIMQIFSASASALLGFFQQTTGTFQGAYRVISIIAIIALVTLQFSDNKLLKKPGEKPVPVKISNKKEA